MSAPGTQPSVSVVVPWRDPDDADRRAAWAWLRQWYAATFPGWEIIEADCPDPEWNKPTAVNTGVDRASGEVIVLADADVLPVRGALLAAVNHARRVPWVVPHGKVLRLRREPTANLLMQNPGRVGRVPTAPLVRPAYTGMPGGGLLVITKRKFFAAGGFDPGFVRWGVEDSCFGIAADTLLGEHLRYHHQPLVHLYHNPGRRETNPHYGDNVRRKRSYTAAQGDPEAMARLRDVVVLDPQPITMSRPHQADPVEDWLLYLYVRRVSLPRTITSKSMLIRMAASIEA